MGQDSARKGSRYLPVPRPRPGLQGTSVSTAVAERYSGLHTEWVDGGVAGQPPAVSGLLPLQAVVLALRARERRNAKLSTDFHSVEHE